MLTTLIPKLAAKWHDSKGKIIVTLALIAAAVWFWNDYKDTKAQLRNQVAQTSTLSEDFRALGKAFVGQGEVLKNDRDLFAVALKAQGEELAKSMKSQDAKVMALFESQGKILAELVKNRPPTTVDYGPDGSFRNARMVQARSKGPALTELSLNYDPKNPDPTKRLLGDWRNYEETFTHSVGEWQKADGGIVGTFRLTREVRDGGKVVGTEDIPLTNARTVVNPRAFDGMGFTVPRLTVQFGAAWDWQKKTWGPAALADYRITDHWGVGGGIAGNQFLVTTSFRIGGK